jgi:hypothetical protein
VRTISLSKRILALTAYLLLVLSSSGMAAQVACPAGERELLITNNSPTGSLDWRRRWRASLRMRR